MTIKATFPHSWFTDAGPSSNSNIVTSPSSLRQHPRQQTRSSACAYGYDIDEDDDLDIAQDLIRRNSFDFVVDMANARAASSEQGWDTSTRPTPTAATGRSRPTQRNNGHAQRRAVSGTAEQEVYSELIELSNLPQFIRPGQPADQGPAAPPAAHLPRW